MRILPPGLELYITLVAIIGNLDTVLHDKREIGRLGVYLDRHKNIYAVTGIKIDIILLGPRRTIDIDMKITLSPTHQLHGGKPQLPVISIDDLHLLSDGARRHKHRVEQKRV